ncbi:cytochrome c oxidase assembly protein [Kitasatospora sp. MAP5-34]|uniref:cytochrome c oxidase assembly protein n=1 Tax=Kitasatospora sp. MAP5-34 TaxID=3035102 RepID=UPI0024741556|nr:cytochrome c oxidase assembly protein [Kitasatospora sp. MAP5-34]
MKLAGGYGMPPEWTLGRVFTEWTLEPVVAAVAVLALAGYLLGVARLRRSGEPWARGRTVAFGSGVALWVFTTCSGIGVYERVLFTDRAVQAVVLLMVVPLLLAMGAPVTVLAEGFGGRHRDRLLAALRGRVSKVLMFPLVSTVLLVVPPWLLYFTSWYRLSLTTDLYNVLFHVGFVAFGLAYFWPRLQIDPVGRHYHPMIGVVITVAEVIFDAALGFILVFGSHLLVPDYWAALARPWGMSAQQDQSWGGAVLWGLGDIAGIPFMVALIVRVIREERVRTVQVDRELDAQEAAEAAAEVVVAAAGVTEKTDAAEAPAEQERPWWETDPRFAGRYGK